MDRFGGRKEETAHTTTTLRTRRRHAIRSDSLYISLALSKDSLANAFGRTGRPHLFGHFFDVVSQRSAFQFEVEHVRELWWGVRWAVRDGLGFCCS